MEPKQRRLMIGVLLFAVVAIPAYWVVWFIDRTVLAVSNEPSYFVFENAFPLADGWIVVCAALAAFALWKRRPGGSVWLPAAGATSVYLAFMDLLFDLENGIFKAPTGDWVGVGIEMANIALTFAGGVYALWWTWRNRAWLAGR